MAADKTESVSPPTQRVVSVVEMLAADGPRTSAQVADALGLSRSTVGAVLQGLHQRAWVRRRADLSYELGPALRRIAGAAMPDPVEAELRALARTVDCGVALLRLDGGELRFDAVIDEHGPIPPGIAVGTRLPLIPPAAATLVAHAGPELRRHWLAAAEPARRAEYERLLTDIPAVGAAVWGVDSAGLRALDVLADVVAHLAHEPGSRALRHRVLSLLFDISGTAHDPRALAADNPLPVSYLAAPVLAPDGTPRAELLIGPLRTSVPKPDRDHYLAALTESARTIGRTSPPRQDRAARDHTAPARPAGRHARPE
ncbi:helix-turn-helix domain-containing protein [Nocardia farcinica]|uniref:MarR family transcriptional regulator n=1 Tax=Nocardia farcinica TaxID=37329 RepID=UPI001892DC3E|nr:MarR family transcriptional regulator [Nocardia farcinica]MBF6417663.1 helix-turn-helix domain-containing protein [Nocardia farcinica]MBF6428833.1 helix-turn-helix domain-containing protein [Nocardia farcinica]MBF6502023.1 helix-turn-helix domain-containing protein [Nocardia farcinica]